MATSKAWKLRRYGRLVPGSGVTGAAPWKDSILLLCGSDTLKIHQRSDNLMFRFTPKGEGRLMRMQFDGRTQAEATKRCSAAVEKLREYAAITRDDALPTLNQSPAEVPAPEAQAQTVLAAAVTAEPEVVQGSLSVKRLTQHYLGEAAVILPEAYRHCFVAQGELEPILRLCLLDPSFPALVEKVEGELRKLREE
ncbi:meiotic recombination protein REC114 isoform X3 [Nelusetta ayraudi]|uniref:meiotic recombination protein REC114 isoform X3 n=1 Tax=Nelusetta ayraudi TaxID=303726 RepID=UPI003F6F1E52